MKRALRIAGAVLGALVLLVAGAFVVGGILPRDHTASVQATYTHPPERVFEEIADVGRSAEWRRGVDSVRVVTDPDSRVRWIEYSDFGSVEMVRERAEPPQVLVGRIADESEGFGGTWTFVLEPEGGGTRLTITERGVVYNPLFRFMSRFVFGHYRSLEQYAEDLGRRLGDSVIAARVSVQKDE